MESILEAINKCIEIVEYHAYSVDGVWSAIIELKSLKCRAELDNYDKEIRDKTIDECIKTLAKDENTILTDKQYHTLQQLKERL